MPTPSPPPPARAGPADTPVPSSLRGGTPTVAIHSLLPTKERPEHPRSAGRSHGRPPWADTPARDGRTAAPTAVSRQGGRPVAVATREGNVGVPSSRGLALDGRSAPQSPGTAPRQPTAPPTGPVADATDAPPGDRSHPPGPRLAEPPRPHPPCPPAGKRRPAERGSPDTDPGDPLPLLWIGTRAPASRAGDRWEPQLRGCGSWRRALGQGVGGGEDSGGQNRGAGGGGGLAKKEVSDQ